jgi:N-acetylglucosamine kinase-like BadF-type ATPase
MTASAPVGLGIDCGGSGTRWRLVRRGPDGLDEALGDGQLGPLSGLAFLPGADAAVRDAGSARIAQLAREVRGALRAAGAGPAPDAIRAGVTGLSDGDAAARSVCRGMAEAIGTPADRVHVLNDMSLAFLSHFPAGAGILVYAGTGAIAVHVDADGRLLRAGGHGYLVDDAGGGYWIGREALRAVLREADRRGRPAEGPLAEAIYAALGAHAWPELRRIVYRGGRTRIASLTPAVGAALAAGDPVAAAIVRDAGGELARLARVLLARLGRRETVALAGGTARLGAPLVTAVAGALPAGIRLDVASIDPASTAARWALGDAEATLDAAGA